MISRSNCQMCDGDGFDARYVESCPQCGGSGKVNAYGLKPETLAEELEACRFIVLNGNPEEHRLRLAHALERAARVTDLREKAQALVTRLKKEREALGIDQIAIDHDGDSSYWTGRYDGYFDALDDVLESAPELETALASASPAREPSDVELEELLYQCTWPMLVAVENADFSALASQPGGARSAPVEKEGSGTVDTRQLKGPQLPEPTGGAREAKQGLGFSCGDCGHQCLHGGAQEDAAAEYAKTTERNAQRWKRGAREEETTDDVLPLVDRLMAIAQRNYEQSGDGSVPIVRGELRAIRAALAARPPRVEELHEQAWKDARLVSLETDGGVIADRAREACNDSHTGRAVILPDETYRALLVAARPPRDLPGPTYPECSVITCHECGAPCRSAGEWLDLSPRIKFDPDLVVRPPQQEPSDEQLCALLHEYAERYRIPATANTTRVIDYADRIRKLFAGVPPQEEGTKQSVEEA